MVPSTLFETGVCVCVCVYVWQGEGQDRILLFSRVRCSIPPPRKSDFEGCAQAHFQRSGPVIALTKRVGNFFFIRVGQAIFHHKLEINWNHKFARDQIRMTAASTVSLVCITVSNFPYPLYRKEHQHVEPIYQNFSKIKIRNKSTFSLHFSDPLINISNIQNSGFIKLSSHNHHTNW